MHHDDDVVNPSDNATLQSVVAERISRRSLLRGATATASVAVALSGADALLGAVPAHADGRRRHHGYGKGLGRPAGTPLLGFEGVPVSTDDTVIVPPGYRADVLIAWGDPVSNGPAFRPDAGNTADEQAQQWGMNNDGLVYFPINGSSAHGLIVQNHEYTDDGLLFTDGAVAWNADKTAKSQNAHGVGIIEVRRRRRGPWEVVRPSRYARRITAQTPIEIGGPAAGHPWLQTAADPSGTAVLGTINNCAMGYTPWGTYLACEENFNGYFHVPAGTAVPDSLSRYGVSAPISASGTQWYTTDTRFNVATEPNEAHRFGWVVEINPWDRNSTPVKRTALGRVKHEGAWVQEARDGRVVVYMGDDQAFEYIYRFVSNLPWREAMRNGINPLDEGVLYAARFDANGTGQWLALTPETVGWPIEEILINTRRAADLVGATKMDRPEWIDTYPDELMAIATLTNNSGRGGAGGAVDAANPRPSNVYGHIIRWGYDYDFTDDGFWWDIFALGGDRNAAVPDGSTVNGDRFGSPDGLYVAPSGRLWIQTDVSSGSIETGAYVGFGNNQMLCADPATRRVRRFLVGPRRCEITGCFATPDETTLFVGVQHPGEPNGGPTPPGAEMALSTWPSGGRPRAALLAITKDDGGEIGS